MRDSTFTLQALHWLNLDWEADEFMQFVADLEPNADGGAADHVRDRRAARPDGVHARRPLRLRRRAAGADRQRRVRPAAERRLRRRARLDPPAHRAQPAAAAPAVADRRDPGRVRDPRLARARPGHLGGPRRAPALRVLEAHVLGGDGPRGEARRRSAATPSWRDGWSAVAEEIRADILEHGVASRRRAAPALRRRTRSTRPRCSPRSSASCRRATRACARACWRSPTT